jgi:hypothetical protein
MLEDIGSVASTADGSGIVNRPHHGDHSHATTQNLGEGRLLKTAVIPGSRPIVGSSLEIVVETGCV